jgi:hypothetical protein
MAGAMLTLPVAYGTAIATAAARHNLDPYLLAAVAAQETGGPGADSGRNVLGDGGHGHGLFQIDDRWHPFARSSAAMDPAANADYAAGLLADNLRRYGGDVRAALSAYNGGSPTATGTTTDWGDGKTLSYADSVLRHYDRLSPHTIPGKDERSMSLLSMLGGAAQGFLLSGGNPIGAIAGGIGGAVGGAGGVAGVGGLANGVQGGADAAMLAGYQALETQNTAFELALNSQAQQFNQMTEEKSELMREQNELRTVAMTQRKADDSITKEFIKMIV